MEYLKAYIYIYNIIFLKVKYDYLVLYYDDFFSKTFSFKVEKINDIHKSVGIHLT